MSRPLQRKTSKIQTYSFTFCGTGGRACPIFFLISFYNPYNPPGLLSYSSDYHILNGELGVCGNALEFIDQINRYSSAHCFPSTLS